MTLILIIKLLISGFLGGFITYLGYNFKTWQFWVLIICIQILMIISGIQYGK